MGLTVRGVATKAGVSMGTLDQYFATREALLAGWEERRLQEINARVFAKLAEIVETAPPLEVAVFVMAEMALSLATNHMSAYPRGDADTFFSRAVERQELQEAAVTGE